MFEKIEPLRPSTHQDLRLSPVSTFDFARHISAAKLSFSELRHASRHYPIVFSKHAADIPQALFSINNSNTFIDKNGKWTVPYIPLFFRLYPFTLAKIKEQEEKFALCIDPDAEHFKSGMGEPLFTADGQLSEFVQNILKSLEAYQKELEITQNLSKVLNEKELIADRVFKCMVNQEEKKIDGLRGVDIEKMLTLDDKTLADMVKNGTIGMVHEHTHSLNNLSKLLTSAPAPAVK